MTLAAPTTLAYERKYHEAVLTLIFYSRRLHTHLDWHKPSLWIDNEANHLQLAFEHGELSAVMGVSQPVNGSAWLRLMALRTGFESPVTIGSMWDAIQQRLRVNGVQQVAALVFNKWLMRYLPTLGFDFVEDVVTMQRKDSKLPPAPDHDFQIRPSYLDDVPTMHAIDHSAFSSPWQMLQSDLRQAQRRAASTSVIAHEGKLVGYQIGTRHHAAGHLARIAVLPEMQGQGVGKALLYHLLEKFQHRSVKSMTVNTQAANIHSQRLYERYGFFRNGFDLPVWMARI